MMNLFKNVCKIASKKEDVERVVSTLVDNSCGLEVTIRRCGDEGYSYEFLANEKQYYAIIDALKGYIKVYYRDNFGKELCREP
jgi:hypothetical protein